MTKKVRMKSNKVGKVRMEERYLAMINTGEELGSNIMEQLSEYGASFEGLVIETYALCKAWAALKAISESRGFDFEDLFESLLPSFVAEMRAALKEG